MYAAGAHASLSSYFPLAISHLSQNRIPRASLYRCFQSPSSILSLRFPSLSSAMRRFISVARASPLLTRSSYTTTSPLRAFTTSVGAKTPAPSNTKDSQRRTGDYGPASDGQVAMEQEGQSKSKASGVSSQNSSQSKSHSASTSSSSPSSSSSSSSSSSAPSSSGGSTGSYQEHGSSQTEKAKQALAGQTKHTHPTPTPEEAMNRKASGKSSTHGNSATEVHRKQEDYTKRDAGTGAEANVAADRAAHDPLPDKDKHSTKVQGGSKK